MIAPESAPPDITELLNAVALGGDGARDALYNVVYADLHKMARGRLYQSGSISILDSPGLVSEAYIRMLGKEATVAKNRKVFFTYASQVMRNIILDYVKQSNAEKRGSGETDLTLYTEMAGVAFRNDQFDSLEQALSRLQRIDARACSLVELRYFGGMTMEECAETLGISSATATRDWELARGFLARELTAA